MSAKSQPQDSILEIHSDLVLKGQLSMEKDVVLTGKFEGDLQTLGCLTVAAGGTATGTIEAGALVLEPGNQVEAKVKVGIFRSPKSSGAVKRMAENKWSSRLKQLKELAFGRK